MKIVYIAGPHSADNSWKREQNIREAETMGVKLLARAEVGLIVPHAMARYWFGKVSEDLAVAMGLELVRRSDALLVVGRWSKSRGALGEIQLAMSLCKPVFVSVTGVQLWNASDRIDRRHTLNAAVVALHAERLERKR